MNDRMDARLDNHLDNQHLPAWLGSLLFHAAVLALFLLWFSLLPTQKTAPGARIAAGSIILLADHPEQNEPMPETAEKTAVPDDDPDPVPIESESAEQSPENVPPVIAPGQPAAGSPHIPIPAVEGRSASGGGNIGAALLQGGETTVKLFGTEGKGTKFMFVFDRSGSMDGAPIRAAKAELIRSLDALGDLHQFNILFYSGQNDLHFWRSGKKLVYATPTEKGKASRFVEGITAGGGTRHFEPLREAVQHRPDVIFFLTDGERQDDLKALELQQIEKHNSRSLTQINVIQFGRGGFTDAPSASLQQLAVQSGGMYRYVDVSQLK